IFIPSHEMATNRLEISCLLMATWCISLTGAIDSGMANCSESGSDIAVISTENWIQANKTNWPKLDSEGGDREFYLYYNSDTEGRLFNLKPFPRLPPGHLNLMLSFKVIHL